MENTFNITKSNCYEAGYLPTEQRRLLLCSPCQSPPGARAPSPLLHIQSRGRAVGSLPLGFLCYFRAKEDVFLCGIIQIYKIFFWNIFTLFTQEKKKKAYSISNMLYEQLWQKKINKQQTKYKQNLKRCRSFISEIFPFLLELEVLMKGRNFPFLTGKRTTTSEKNKSVQPKTLEIFH